MKRSVKILLAILMVSLLVLSLSACQDPCADGHLYTPGEITKQPTCTSEGERTYTCSRCGQTFTQSIGKLPHSLQTLEGKPATCADAGLTSSFKCSVCGEIIPPQEAIPMLPAHTWDNGTVTTEPKCKDGEITFKCTVCGATRTEQLAARHNYDNGVLTVAPTCGDYGQRVYTCKDCGKTYQVLVAPMADQHVFGPWVEETDEHVGYFQCQNCGKYFDKDGNLLPSINKGEQLPVWKLVTSDSTPIALGDRIVIVASTADMAMCTTQKTNNRDGVAITRDAATQTIVITREVQIITVEAGKTEGTFALAVGTGQYLRGAGTSNSTLKTTGTLDDESSWTIEVSADGIATVKSQGTNTRNWLRYNSTGSNHLFNCYESGQDDIQIYRYTGSGEIVIPGEHECQHQCPTCGKCTSDCDDPACADKCLGHESADDKGKTQDNPLTVEEAIALMKEAGSGVVVGAAEKQQYYVKGVVSGSTVDTQFHEWTFTLGTGSEKATCQAKINSSVSVEFPERNGALDGATVIIHGFLELFNGQYKIAYLPASASPTGDKFTPDVVEVVLPADAHFCQHVCPQCGLCTDETCDNAKCQPKCQGHEEDPEAFTPLETPRTGEYYLGMYSTNKSAWYYFTGVMGGANNYYYATSTEKDSAALVVVEASGSGYHFKVKSSGNYLNLGPRGTDYTSSSLSIGATATTVWTWDATQGVFYTELSNGGTTTKFYLGNYSTYTDLSGMKYFNDGNYAAVLGTFGQPEPECQHTNRTEHPLKEATCTEDGNIQYWSCNDCGKLFNAATGGDIIEQSTTVLKAGHKYSATEVPQVDAKCEKDGVKAHYTCENCDKTFIKDGDSYVERSDEQLAIPQLGHNYAGQPWQQSAEGKTHYQECKNGCGTKNVADCNTDAWEQTDKTHQKKCSDCGRLDGTAEGHTFVEHVCSACGFSEHAAQVGGEYFKDLAAALNKALTLEGAQTIKLLANNSGAGLRFTEHTGKITIDLGTFTYTVNAAVGSAGTESQALQVLPGAEVEIKGGTIAAETGKGVVRLVNNYGNLTLNGVTLDATNVSGCDAAVVAYSGELALTNVTFKAVPETAYALSATYWSKYSAGVTVTVDELTNFATGNKGVEIDLDRLKGETSPTGAEVTVTFTKEQRTEGADNYTIKVLGSTCDDLTAVTFNGTKISHNYSDKNGEKHECRICNFSELHQWTIDSASSNHDEHTYKCKEDGCTATKTEHHDLTLKADGDKDDQTHTVWCEQCKYSEKAPHDFTSGDCECGQPKPAPSKTATIEYTDTVNPSKNMRGDPKNDANEYFGLNANVFTITSVMTSGTNQVGLNKEGSIRLYKDSAVTLKISVTSDFEIEKITVTLLDGANRGKCAAISSLKVTKGSDSATVSGDNGEYVINGTTVSLTNTDDTNPICIKSIVVTYKRVNGVDPATYPVTINCDSEKGTYTTDPKYIGEVEEGTEVKLTITAEAGWQVKSVTCNGEPLSLEEETYYKFKVTQAMTIQVEFEEHVVSGGAKWVLLTDVGDLKAGSEIVIVNQAGTNVAGALNGNYLSDISKVVVSGNEITTLPDGALILTLVADNSNWKLKTPEGKFLGMTGASKNKLAYDSGTMVWEIKLSTNNEAIIRNTFNKDSWQIQYNSGRFSNYKNTTENPKIYVKTEE